MTTPVTTPPHDVLARGHVLIGPYGDVVMVALAALPAAALVTWALARRRRSSGTRATLAWRRSLAEVGIVYGTAPFVWLTMLPRPQVTLDSGGVSLVPLRDLATMPTGQVVGNLLGLAALGFFGPVRLAALTSLRRVLAVAATASLLIETVQYVLPLGRVASVDDVLLNTAGAGVAALLSLPWWHARGGGERRHDVLAAGAAAGSGPGTAGFAAVPSSRHPAESRQAG